MSSSLNPVLTPSPYEALQRGEIRLLEVQPGLFDDPIHCRLVTASLDENVKYDAISYVWGDPTIRVSIMVEDLPLQLTVNLEGALRHIRDTDESRVLWADGVCINQDDVAEVSAQVQEMRRIYSQAQNVLIWLGPASGEPLPNAVNTFTAFERLKECANWYKETPLDDNGNRPLQLCKDESNNRNWVEKMKTMWSWLSSEAVSLPLRSPYWHRLWIIQEAALAKSLVVLNGPYSMPFDDLCDGLYFAISSVPEFTGLAEMYTRWVDQLTRIQYYRNSRINKRYLLLTELLRETLDVAATDPRDRVYGLLGLADDGGEIIPDYSLTVDEVYTAASKHVISHGDMTLMTFFPTRKNKSPGIPSWVADWRMDVSGHANPRPMTFGPHIKKYRASANMSKDVKFTEHDSVLVSKGMLVDNVDICGSVMDPKSHSHFDILQQWEDLMIERFGNGYTSDNQGYTIPDVLHCWETRTLTSNNSWPEGHTVHVSGDWSLFMETLSVPKRDKRRVEHIGIPLKQGPYVSGGSVTEAYCRTLLLDTGFDSGDRLTSEQFSKFFEEASVPEWNEDMYKPTQRELWRIQMLRESQTFDKSLQGAICHRRLFVTSKGYIGLGPGDMQIDDKVCVVFGSTVPFVLRPSDSQWQLVGECYTHGIMDGEIATLLEESKLAIQSFEIR